MTPSIVSERITTASVIRHENGKGGEKRMASEWEELEKLSKEEIESIVVDILNNKLSKIEISAWLTSLYINGMDIDEIADLMLEVLCTQGSFMRIGGKQLYTALVKERFLKLDSSHIEYVLDCLRESTADIRNIKAYLLEMLFNAPTTCGSYYRAKVNHDFHDSG